MRRDGSSIAATFSLTKGKAKCGSIFEHAAVGAFGGSVRSGGLAHVSRSYLLASCIPVHNFRYGIELVCLDPFFFERNLVELDEGEYHAQAPATRAAVRAEAIRYDSDFTAEPVPNHKADIRVLFSVRQLAKHHGHLATGVGACEDGHHGPNARIGCTTLPQVLDKQRASIFFGRHPQASPDPFQPLSAFPAYHFHGARFLFQFKQAGSPLGDEPPHFSSSPGNSPGRQPVSHGGGNRS